MDRTSMGSNTTVSASVESRLSLIQSAETGLVSFGCCSIVATALAGDLAFLEAPALLSRRHLPPDDVADHIAHWLPRDSAVPWQQKWQHLRSPELPDVGAVVGVPTRSDGEVEPHERIGAVRSA